MEFAPSRTAGVFIFPAVIRDGGLEEVVIRITDKVLRHFYSRYSHIPGTRHPSEFPKLRVIEQDEKVVGAVER